MLARLIAALAAATFALVTLVENLVCLVFLARLIAALAAATFAEPELKLVPARLIAMFVIATFVGTKMIVLLTHNGVTRKKPSELGPNPTEAWAVIV